MDRSLGRHVRPYTETRQPIRPKDPAVPRENAIRLILGWVIDRYFTPPGSSVGSTITIWAPYRWVSTLLLIGRRSLRLRISLQACLLKRPRCCTLSRMRDIGVYYSGAPALYQIVRAPDEITPPPTYEWAFQVIRNHFPYSLRWAFGGLPGQYHHYLTLIRSKHRHQIFYGRFGEAQNSLNPLPDI